MNCKAQNAVLRKVTALNTLKKCPNCEARGAVRTWYEAQTDPISGKRFWVWCYTCGWKR